MSNMLIPAEERTLSPEQVEALDRRRRRGHLLLVIGWQTLIVAVVLTLWSGQDLTYSPGWMHPVFYWNALVALVSATCFLRGIALRRGLNEFFSY
jgi:predicted nucleic acid-binding Zn ribbon protein